MKFFRQESDEEKHLTFYHLWQDEWTKSNPPPVNPRATQSPAHGAMLHQSLFLLENRPGVKNKLKQAVLRTSKPKTKGKTVQCTYQEKILDPEVSSYIPIICFNWYFNSSNVITDWNL